MRRQTDLVDAFKAGRMNRREFAKRAMALGMTGPVITSIILASPGMAGAAPLPPVQLSGRNQSGGGTLVFGAWQTPDTMDPQKTGLAATGRILANVFDPLVWRFPGDDKFYPGLAESWDISADALTYTFNLRTDVKFHNGEAFHAAAVKATFDREADPNNKTLETLPRGYDHAEVVDDATVKIVFKEPYAPFLILLAANSWVTLPPEYAKNADQMSLTPPGTGPFIVKEYVASDHVTLERNPDYNWAPSYFGRQGPALLEKIDWRIIEESGTRASTLQAGETQLIEEIVPAQYETFTADPNLQVILQDAIGCPRTVHLNCTKAPTDDKLVRQAMSYALDKTIITDVIFKKTVVPAYGPLEKLTPGYNPEVEKYYPFDPDKANQLLDQAGWTKDGDTRKKDGQELKALFIVIAKDNFDEPAQVIQSAFADVGIGLDLTTEAEPTVFNTYNRGDQNLANIFWWGADPESLYSLYHSSQIAQGFNWAHYTNADVDKLLEQGYVESDDAKRMDLYKQAQILIMEDAPCIPVWGKRATMAGLKSISGINWSPRVYPLHYNTTLG